MAPGVEERSVTRAGPAERFPSLDRPRPALHELLPRDGYRLDPPLGDPRRPDPQEAGSTRHGGGLSDAPDAERNSSGASTPAERAALNAARAWARCESGSIDRLVRATDHLEAQQPAPARQPERGDRRDRRAPARDAPPATHRDARQGRRGGGPASMPAPRSASPRARIGVTDGQ